MVLDAEIPVKSRSEVKSALVSALASHGRTSDAIIVYEEIKEAGCNLEPRAVIALIVSFAEICLFFYIFSSESHLLFLS